MPRTFQQPNTGLRLKTPVTRLSSTLDTSCGWAAQGVYARWTTHMQGPRSLSSKRLRPALTPTAASSLETSFPGRTTTCPVSSISKQSPCFFLCIMDTPFCRVQIEDRLKLAESFLQNQNLDLSEEGVHTTTWSMVQRFFVLAHLAPSS